MKLPRCKFLNLATVVLVAAALVALPAIDAWSQSARPIRVVLPFAPGGPADAMARLLAEQIGSAGGPTMVVESRPGAGIRDCNRIRVARGSRRQHSLNYLTFVCRAAASA